MKYMFWDADMFNQCLKNWNMQQVKYNLFYVIFNDFNLQKRCMPQLG